MLTDTIASSPDARSMGGIAAYLLKLMSGPIVFALVLGSPVPMSYQGHVTLATFACVVAWWMTQPIPWAIAAPAPSSMLSPRASSSAVLASAP